MSIKRSNAAIKKQCAQIAPNPLSLIFLIKRFKLFMRVDPLDQGHQQPLTMPQASSDGVTPTCSGVVLMYLDLIFQPF